MGSNHPDTADSYHQIAEAQRLIGDHDESMANYKKAWVIRKDTFGTLHPIIADTMCGMAELLLDQGYTRQALADFNKALAIYELKVTEDSHPKLADCYNSIGKVKSKQGLHEEALVEYRKALSMYVSVFGMDHPKTKIAKDNVFKTISKKVLS